MIVSFPFTFKFSYPGLPNPFTPNYHPHPLSRYSPLSLPHEDHTAPTSSCHSHEPVPMAHSLNWFATLNPPSHITPTMHPRPRNLKRGWEPAFAEASQSTTTLASSSGYLNTPAKCRMTDTEAEHDQHQGRPSSCHAPKLCTWALGFFRVLMMVLPRVEGKGRPYLTH
jgi:hypothetical protein